MVYLNRDDRLLTAFDAEDPWNLFGKTPEEAAYYWADIWEKARGIRVKILKHKENLFYLFISAA